MPCHHEISQPHSTAKFSQKKKKNIMFHFPICSKRLKKKKHPGVKAPQSFLTQKEHHHTSTSNSSPSKVSGLPFFIPKKKKKTWIWQRRPRPPELRQSTSATNLDPRGNKKHQKVGFQEHHFWMIWIFSMLKGKRLDFVGMTFFLDDFLLLRMLFESYILVWEIWILLDDFFLKKVGFLRQAGLHGRLW